MYPFKFRIAYIVGLYVYVSSVWMAFERVPS
jgi:hypothetical protein